jgi:hypothetical protein
MSKMRPGELHAPSLEDIEKLEKSGAEGLAASIALVSEFCPPRIASILISYMEEQEKSLCKSRRLWQRSLELLTKVTKQALRDLGID